jgi:hypothetical protein
LEKIDNDGFIPFYIAFSKPELNGNGTAGLLPVGRSRLNGKLYNHKPAAIYAIQAPIRR